MLACATTFEDFSSCRVQRGDDSASAFAEAAARVEAALCDLRAAESSLERQLSDLHLYRTGTGEAKLPVSGSRPMSRAAALHGAETDFDILVSGS